MKEAILYIVKELIIYNVRCIKDGRLWNDYFILWESNKSQVKFYVPKASYNQVTRLVNWVTNVEMKRKSYKSKITSYVRQCISQCWIDINEMSWICIIHTKHCEMNTSNILICVNCNYPPYKVMTQIFSSILKILFKKNHKILIVYKYPKNVVIM